MYKSFQVVKGIFLVALVIGMFGGCGAASETVSYNSADTSVFEEAEMYEQSMSNGSAVGILDAGEELLDKDLDISENESGDILSERKLIKTVRMNAETKEFDSFTKGIEKQISDLNGYVENMEIYNGSYGDFRISRSLEMTARIPQKQLSVFLNAVSEICNVVNRSEMVDDVTLSYVDMESRKESLKVEQSRLLELLEKAESLEDILTIEERLTTVRYELESMESQLRTMDNKIDYSTVYLSVSEVRELTPVIEEETVWQRITEGFMSSLKNVGNDALEILIWFVVHIPQLLIFSAGVIVVVLILKKRRKKKAAAKEENHKRMNQSGKDDE